MVDTVDTPTISDIQDEEQRNDLHFFIKDAESIEGLNSGEVAKAIDRVLLPFIRFHGGDLRTKLSAILSDCMNWALAEEKSAVPKDQKELWIELAGYEQERKLLKLFFTAFDNYFYDYVDQQSLKEEAGLLDDNELIPEGSIKKDNDLVKEAKVACARLNQDLADLLYKASMPANAIIRERADFLLAVFNGMELSGLKGRLALDIRGAQAQAALMQILDKAGYYLITPDTQNIKEVEEWDVMAGTDLIAISPEGDMIFIDVKGRIGLNSVVSESRASRGIHQKIRQELIDLFISSQRLNQLPQKYKAQIEELLYRERNKGNRAAGYTEIPPQVLFIPNSQTYLKQHGELTEKGQLIAKQVKELLKKH